MQCADNSHIIVIIIDTRNSLPKKIITHLYFIDRPFIVIKIIAINIEIINQITCGKDPIIPIPHLHSQIPN